MKTKWILPVLMALALSGAAAVGITGCKKSGSVEGDHAHQYTCTMHPEVVQAAPGKCPKCDMQLVEKH